MCTIKIKSEQEKYEQNKQKIRTDIKNLAIPN